MLCSIIMPLYNKANFVEEALQSIFNQTYQNFEVIVVDDGSLDDGPERVKLIKDSRVILVQQANTGVSGARNRGISLAQGDVVCFLDADDWYQTQYLDTIISMAKQYPDLPFFTTKHKLVNVQQGKEKFWQSNVEARIEIIDDFFSRWQGTLFHISSFAVRRNFLLQFQPCFPLGEQMGEDQDLFFRLAERSSFVHCSVPLTGYRVDVNDSLCQNYQGSCLFPSYLRLERRALDQQIPEKLRVSALRLVAYERISSARHALVAGQRWQAVKELFHARHGITSKRWWLTVFMCVFATPELVRRWQNWRNYRVQHE